jgi:hypothetical protein
MTSDTIETAFIQQESEGTNLDAEHYRVVEAVLLRDTAEMRAVVAGRYVAVAQGDVARLEREQRRIGTKEQMDAIRRTGACPDARFWAIGSWLLVGIDGALWFVVGAHVFTV